MRILRYRAYIIPLKRYAEKYETILYHHQCNMEPTWTVNISPEEYYGDEELVIEQDTGLFDRNGKKIYENDIVSVHDSDMMSDHNKFFGDKALVKCSLGKGGAFIIHNWYGERILDWDIPLRFVEVVGTIHENPELLGGKNE